MGDDAVAVGPKGVGVAGGGERHGVGVAELRLEEGKVVARLEVVAQRLDRPEADVAVAVRLLDEAERREHEPLRPAAGDGRVTRMVRVLLLEDRGEDAADGGKLAGGEEPLDRALADIADAPGGGAVLLEAMRG